MKKYRAEFKKAIPWLALAFFVISTCLVVVPSFLLPSQMLGSMGTGQGTANTIALMSPLIAIIAAALTFVAFWVQYEANAQQRKDISQERLATRFYQLLAFHNSNIENLRFNSQHGRVCFSYYFEEYKAIFLTIKGQNVVNNADLPDKVMMNMAYKIFFEGAGYVKHHQDEFSDGNEQKVLSRALKVIEGYKSATASKKGTNYPKDGEVNDSVNNKNFKFSIYEHSFEGHATDLSHIYRNLYHMVKVIVQSEILNSEQQFEFLRMLRAQLSNEEQLLLYFNGASDYGKKWINRGFFFKYRMIRNMPLPLTNWGVNPLTVFAQEIQKQREPNRKVFAMEKRENN